MIILLLTRKPLFTGATLKPRHSSNLSQPHLIVFASSSISSHNSVWNPFFFYFLHWVLLALCSHTAASETQASWGRNAAWELVATWLHTHTHLFPSPCPSRLLQLQTQLLFSFADKMLPRCRLCGGKNRIPSNSVLMQITWSDSNRIWHEDIFLCLRVDFGPL